MVKLIQKVANCYQYYLNRLSYGITSQDYDLLYDAILFLKSGLIDAGFEEFFENNLNCVGDIVLPQTDTISNMIAWAFNSTGTVNPSTVFISSPIPDFGTFSITTNSVTGYNYLYIAVPQNKNTQIYDEMTSLMFDSTVAGSYDFTYIGNLTMSNESINSIYRKNDVFNTYNPITYYVKIF